MDARKNTLARYRLLKDALEGKKNIPSALLKACNSQGGLANLCLASKHIEPMSLNTLKTWAAVLIENGGWEILDRMRVAYLEANDPPKPITHKSTTTRLKELGIELTNTKDSLTGERRYRIRLQVAYNALLAKMHSIAETDPDLAHFINRHVTGFSFKQLSIVGARVNDEDE